MGDLFRRYNSNFLDIYENIVICEECLDNLEYFLSLIDKNILKYNIKTLMIEISHAKYCIKKIINNEDIL